MPDEIAVDALQLPTKTNCLLPDFRTAVALNDSGLRLRIQSIPTYR